MHLTPVSGMIGILHLLRYAGYKEPVRTDAVLLTKLPTLPTFPRFLPKILHLLHDYTPVAGTVSQTAICMTLTVPRKSGVLQNLSDVFLRD